MPNSNEPKVTGRRQQGSIITVIEYDEAVNREEVEKFVESKNFFGRHPCGYGGILQPYAHQKDGQVNTKWEWWSSDSCD